MGNELDLTFLSLYRINGQEWPLLPGLFAQTPPRRAARGREQDRLLIYLTLSGNVLYSSAEYGTLTKQMADRFYQTTGSLTHALKITAESINAFLIERNMKTTGQGQYNIGLLVLGALRGNDFYIVQSGPTRAFWIGAQGAQQFFDPQLAGRGLGLSQTTKLYYARVSIGPGDRFVFGAQMPPAWIPLLEAEKGAATLDVSRRKLMAGNEAGINALLLQVEAGTGQISVLNLSKDSLTSPATPTSKTDTPDKAGQTGKTDQAGFASVPARPMPAHIEPAKTPPADQPARVVPTPSIPMPARITPVAIRPAQVAPIKKEEYAPEPKPLITKARGEEYTRMAARFLAKTLQSARTFSRKLGDGFNKMIPRLLPGQDEGEPSFSSSSLAFIAIIVPVVVVVIALAVYLGIGQPAQHDLYYQKAVAAFQQSNGQTDPAELRRAWEETLAWLDKAEVYQTTDESKSLRVQAQNGLDSINRILRLNFQPATTAALSPNVNIVQMTASDTDLYMLNSVNGNVMRAFHTGNGYDLDGGFKCEPGAYEGGQIGMLVDIVALPKSNPRDATVMGIDASGNLIYCAPDAAPQVFPLVAPEFSWKQVTAIAYDANNLYVLDAGNNAVWTYFGEKIADFPNAPIFFFNEQIPDDMPGVIDIAVNGDDLYLLHRDGHLTTCTLSRLDVSPTRCQNPNFIDTRPGYQGGPKLSDGVFTQIVFTSPPNASVALLQPYTQAAYRFTPRSLELESQLSAYVGKESPFPAGTLATAMTFSPNHILFMLVNGQVYYATDVP